MFFKKGPGKLTQPEIQAINKKIGFPELDIFCPRCKKLLKYYAVGNAAEVKCPSKNCIRGSSRGIYIKLTD